MYHRHLLNDLKDFILFLKMLFILLVITHRLEGVQVHTSGTHFTFWFLTFLFNFLILRTTVKAFLAAHVGIVSVVTEGLYLTTLFIQLAIHCWSDHSDWEHLPLDEGNPVFRVLQCLQNQP